MKRLMLTIALRAKSSSNAAKMKILKMMSLKMRTISYAYILYNGKFHKYKQNKTKTVINLVTSNRLDLYL